MKRLILFLHIIVLSCAFCHASNDNKADSVRVWYETCENDTIVFEEIPPFVICGLKGLQDTSPVNCGNLHPDKLNDICNEYIKICTRDIINNILSGYGKKTCCKILNQHKTNSSKRTVLFIRVRLGIKGKVVAVQFYYPKYLSEFFTIKNVIHNSNIVVNSEPTSILIKHGIILSPWITFPIGLENIQEFLSEM